MLHQSRQHVSFQYKQIRSKNNRYNGFTYQYINEYFQSIWGIRFTMDVCYWDSFKFCYNCATLHCFVHTDQDKEIVDSNKNCRVESRTCWYISRIRYINYINMWCFYREHTNNMGNYIISKYSDRLIHFYSSNVNWTSDVCCISKFLPFEYNIRKSQKCVFIHLDIEYYKNYNYVAVINDGCKIRYTSSSFRFIHTYHICFCCE